MIPFEKKEEKLIYTICEECNVDNIELFVAKIAKFYEILTDVNSNLNLTRIRSEEDFWIKHIFDSLYIGKYFSEISKDKLKILDLGCGGGFPSIPLAIAFDNLEIVALDSIKKKTDFVDSIAKKMQLNNLSVFAGRARELNRKKEWTEQFDIVTARAVAESKVIFRETRNFLKETGRYILYKTPEQISNEFAETAKISAKNGFDWSIKEEYSLPNDLGKRQFLMGENNVM